jgi:hypothetical protein
MENVKAITGGDPINLRGMRETDTTVNPTCNLFALTNEMPVLPLKNNATDTAIKNRIVVIPFNNSFPVNSNFKNTILECKNEIFNYIMQKGRLIENDIELSEEMKFSKSEYENDNAIDYLKEFTMSRLEKCENDKENKPLPVVDVRSSFINYCGINKLRVDNITPIKFTKKLKALGYELKESHGVTKVYKVKWSDGNDEDEDETTDI